MQLCVIWDASGSGNVYQRRGGELHQWSAVSKPTDLSIWLLLEERRRQEHRVCVSKSWEHAAVVECVSHGVISFKHYQLCNYVNVMAVICRHEELNRQINIRHYKCIAISRSAIHQNTVWVTVWQPSWICPNGRRNWSSSQICAHFHHCRRL